MFPSLSVRSRSARRRGHVSDVGPGPGHSGTVRPPSESLRLPLVPHERPARSVLPAGSGRRLLLPAGRPALHHGRTEYREDTAG